jgi:microcystin-dependent protein
MVGIILAVNYVIQFKRQLSSAWSQVNPKLKIGEPGFEIDTGRLKIGDGVTRWNSLPYQDTAVVDDISETLDRLSVVEDDVEEIQDDIQTINTALPGIVPPGVISQFAGTSAPTGYLLCTGQELAISSYQNLYNVLGTTYGSLTNGSGSAGTTHFRLPNLQNRVPVGRGAETEFDTLGEVGGAKTVTLNHTQIPAHSHPNTLSNNTVASSGHTHEHISPVGLNSGNPVVLGPNVGALGARGSYSYDGAIQTSTSTGFLSSQNTTFERHKVTSNGPSANTTIVINNANNTDGGGAHNNLQPYIVLNYIIKT